MTVQDFFLRTPLLAETKAEIERAGLVVEVGHDFERFAAILHEARGQVVSPPFDPSLHNLSETNAFWIVGRTSEGAVAHLQAVRLYDLGPVSLGEYMLENFRDFPPVGVELDMAGSRYRAGPGARRIRGRVCYHGEMWLDEEKGQFRGKGMAWLLTRLGFLVAEEALRPDYVFALMAAPVAFKGLPQRAGFMHTEPGALTWKLANSARAFEGFMAYVSREDMQYLLRLPAHRTA